MALNDHKTKLADMKREMVYYLVTFGAVTTNEVRVGWDRAAKNTFS